jgi:hypothetical protein
MDWEAIKEQSRLVYARACQVLVFLQLVFYLVACIVANRPIGPKDYVRFAYHVVQWEWNAKASSVAGSLPDTANEPHTTDEPHMNFMANQ